MMAATMQTLVRTLFFLLLACGGPDPNSSDTPGRPPDEAAMIGPHGGRLLTSSDLQVELMIFERGTTPELRAWVWRDGRPLPAADVSLWVELARLGGRVDEISFTPAGDYLRGDSVVAEPHSFEVSVKALHAGETHRWRYESFEGRTQIAPEVAESLGIETALAGPALLEEAVTVYGSIRPILARTRKIRARFDGVIRDVNADVGSVVARGALLLTIESNESLETYSIRAPIAGVVTQRDANPGEQTSDRLLLTITDPSVVWADLSVFPRLRARVRTGSPVSIVPAAGGNALEGLLSTIEVLAHHDQSVTARSVLPNPEGRLVPGTFVTAEITVGEHEVPLAVRREALQTFRDFTVVYAQVADQYEVRMLELGREGYEYVEVLSGLEPGTRYVTANSYIIKADIDKSAAAHDH